MLLYVHRNHRLIRDGEPRTATSTFTHLLSSERGSELSLGDVGDWLLFVWGERGGGGGGLCVSGGKVLAGGRSLPVRQVGERGGKTVVPWARISVQVWERLA